MIPKIEDLKKTNKKSSCYLDGCWTADLGMNAPEMNIVKLWNYSKILINSFYLKVGKCWYYDQIPGGDQQCYGDHALAHGGRDRQAGHGWHRQAGDKEIGQPDDVEDELVDDREVELVDDKGAELVDDEEHEQADRQQG